MPAEMEAERHQERPRGPASGPQETQQLTRCSGARFPNAWEFLCVLVFLVARFAAAGTLYPGHKKHDNSQSDQGVRPRMPGSSCASWCFSWLDSQPREPCIRATRNTTTHEVIMDARPRMPGSSCASWCFSWLDSQPREPCIRATRNTTTHEVLRSQIPECPGVLVGPGVFRGHTRRRWHPTSRPQEAHQLTERNDRNAARLIFLGRLDVLGRAAARLGGTLVFALDRVVNFLAVNRD